MSAYTALYGKCSCTQKEPDVLLPSPTPRMQCCISAACHTHPLCTHTLHPPFMPLPSPSARTVMWNGTTMPYMGTKMASDLGST